MNGIRITIYVVAAVFFVITGCLAWQNRDSENVATNLPTALVVGALGGLLTLLFGLKTEERSHSFSVEYVLEPQTRLPFVSNSFPDGQQYTDAGAWTTSPAWFVLSQFPDVSDNSRTAASDAELEHLYRRVLMRQIIDTLRFTYFKSWDAGPAHIALPSGGIETIYAAREIRPGRKLTNSELVSQFGGDQAFNSKTIEFLNLPPETALTASSSDNENILTLRNNFATVTITVTERGVVSGLGVLRAMCRIGFEEEKGFRRPRYVVSLIANFDRFRSGHPDMPLYKKWVDVMSGEVKRFDSEPRWNTAKERYLLLYAGRTQTRFDELMDETHRKAEAGLK